MAYSFKVTKSEVTEAAQQLQIQLEIFQQATVATEKAAQALCGMWEGDAKEAFRQEQEEAVVLYRQMESVTTELIRSLRTAATRYADADHTAAQMIRNH